ncbi:hypothetical protein [Gymnodinialimonas ulvae]
MYQYYCDPDFDQIMRDARAARRDALRTLWRRAMRKSDPVEGRVAAS